MEYALITGLNYFRLPDFVGLQTTNAFKQRHWPQQKIVSLNDVISQMKNIEAPYSDEKKKNGAIIVCHWCVNDRR